jgi:hypothetical protein
MEGNATLAVRVSLVILKEGAGNIAFRRLTLVTSKKHVVHCTSNFFQWKWTLHSECFLSYRLQWEVHYCQIYPLTCWSINKLHGLVYGEGGGHSPLLINNLFTLPWPWTNRCNYLTLHSDAMFFFFFIKASRYCWGYLYFLIVSLQYKSVGWYGEVAPFQTRPGAHPTRGKTPGDWRWLPTPSSADVEERMELWFYSPLGLHGLFGVKFIFTFSKCKSKWILLFRRTHLQEINDVGVAMSG